VKFGSKHWKSFVHARVTAAVGERGGLSRFGRHPEERRLLGPRGKAGASRLVALGSRRPAGGVRLPAEGARGAQRTASASRRRRGRPRPPGAARRGGGRPGRRWCGWAAG